MQQKQTRPLVELLGVTQRYGRGERQFTAIQDVNLVISEGEFVALLGPSDAARARCYGLLRG
jgi:ABC-type antimicrobial peptide transport system, ATPase component